jgi:hypothetical protein
MSQKIKTSVEIDGSLSASQIANATTDTDKFLVSDGGTIKYRTGAELATDLGIAAGVTSKVQHQVKAGVAINKGQAVYVTGADGTNMIVGLASNAAEATSSKTMGLLNATVSANGFADVITEGLLDGLDTSTAVAGNPVWLGTGGNLIYGLANKPYAPSHLVFIGIVTRVNANNGEIFVKVQNGFELDELHDVDLKTTTPINGHLLGFNGTLWVNKTIAGWLGYTPQAQLNGTGFVKASGTTITYDNTSYYPASNPNGYISTYTETDTLASVTGRGALTNTPIAISSGTLQHVTLADRFFLVGGSNFHITNNAYYDSGFKYKFADLAGKLALQADGILSYQTAAAGTIGAAITFDTRFSVDSSGNLLSTGSLQSPIFYDSNNTGYYLDPASTSNLNALTLAGTFSAPGYNKTNWDTAFGWGNHASAGYVPQARTITINGTSYDLSANRSWTVTATETDTLATVTGRGSSTSTLSSFNGGLTTTKTAKNAYAIQVKGGLYGAPRLQLYDLAIDSNAFVGLGVDMSGASYEFSNYFPRTGGNGRWSVGSWAGDFGTGQYVSGYNEKLWVNESSAQFNVSLTGTVDMRSPIFYDSNNTGFYGDFASTSNFNKLLLNSQNSFNTSTPGLTSYGLTLIGGTTDYANGIIWTWGNTNAQAGVYVQSSGAYGTKMYFATTDSFATGSKTAMHIDHYGTVSVNRSYLQSDSSLRAPIFYDSNDTGYYWNPNTSSGHRFQTPTGYLDMGSMNGSWCHFETDRPNFYFGKSAHANGAFQIYGTSVYLDSSRVQAPVLYDANNTYYYLDPGDNSRLYRLSVHRGIAGGGQNIFTGLEGVETANGRGQLVISSSYSDLVIASSQANNQHGSTLSFTAYNPDNVNSYRKFVINQGNWGTRKHMLSFGYSDTEQTNPHSAINSSVNTLTLDGLNRRVGIKKEDPAYPLDVDGIVNTASGYISVGNPWGTANSAFFPNGITTAGGTNWIYGQTYIGNAPGNGAGHEFFTSGSMNSTGAHSATVYYDYNNSGYYLDPHSSSNLNAVNIQGLLQVAGSTGNYNEGMRLVSGTGSWSNIQFGANMTGAGTQANQWIVGKRPDGNFVMSLAGNQDGGSRFLIQQDGRVQSPVYYDGNDTNYYLDPNGTSNLDTITATRFASRMGSQSPDNSHPGFGIRPFYSWNIGQAYNSSAGYSNGISIGSHPGDQAYGFQIVQNMWDDQLYFRRYNGGWQGWRTALDNTNYGGYCNFGGNSLYAGIFYDGNNSAYYVNPDGTSRMGTINADTLKSYGNLYLDNDYGRTVVGVYSSYRYQGVFSMGSSWMLPSDGTSPGNLYGLSWSHPNAGGQAGYLNNHGLLVMVNGQTEAAISTGIWARGDVTAYSDIRVKDNIKVIDNPLERLKKVRGVTFTRIDLDDKEKRYAGVIAQEMIEALPEVVTENTEGHLSVSYGNSVSLIIECIKEQQIQIEELKELVNKLINK